MIKKISRPLRGLIPVLLGLGLLSLSLITVRAGSPSRLASPRGQIVTVAPGEPIEIAVAMFFGWGAYPDTMDAVQMAIDYYGPIKGFSVQRNDYDAGCDATSGEAAANTIVLTDTQNVGVIGPFCSSSTAGAAPVFETGGVVMITHASTAPDLPTQGPTVFNRMVVEDHPAFDDWDAKIAGLPTVLAWEADFELNFGREPDRFARYAYDAATLLLARIDQVSTVDGSGNLVIDRATLASAVRNTTDYPGVTDYITLDAVGNRIDQVSGSGTRYVATTGDDVGNDCTDMASPCASVQRGVALANSTESVLVAGGIYTENLTINISLTLEGGYEPIGWTRDLGQYQTVIDGSSSQPIAGDWDGASVGKPTVILDGVTYEMWFDGRDLGSQTEVGLATSSDGVAWAKDPNNPVLTGTAGTWDETAGERGAFVLKDGATYKMWYEGWTGGLRQLGYATSSDGVVWTKPYTTPVLQAGPESYDQEVAGHGSVLKEGSTYRLWYHAMGDQGPIIAYATSSDGVNWTKQGPVLTPEGGGWDEFGLWGPSVLNLNGVYWMWYSGAGPSGGPAIGVVTSTNGVDWNRILPSPVITDTEPIGDPQVISETSKLVMWYTDYLAGAIRYAESLDGLTWTKPYTDPVLTTGTPGQFGDPVVRVARDDVTVVLDGLTITGGNGGEAGGVYAGSAAVTIRSCLIQGNAADGSPNAWGGGGVIGGSPLAIIDSRILDNQANQGASAVRIGNGSLAMTNTLVAGNSGAPALHANGAVSLMNVTLADNADGGVLFNPPTDVDLSMTNSIVYGNGSSIEDVGAGTVQVSYSDVEGGWTGTGNIDADPLFADAASGDYRLKGGSPAIDAGTDAGAPPADLDGDARPQDGDLDGTATTDMGAYEFTPYRIGLPIVLRN